MATATYELVESVVLTGNTTTVSFTSMDQSYRDLRLAIYPKWRNNGFKLSMTINNNTSDLYPYQTVSGFSGSEHAADSSGQANDFEIPWVNNGFGDGDESDFYLLEFLDYSQTNKNKSILFRTGNIGVYENVTAAVGMVDNTAAVTSIEFTCTGDLLLAGGRFDLYGIAG